MNPMQMRHNSGIPRRQRGGAAIEFALTFPLFFALFYAIVGYGLVMTLQQSLTEASKEGARRAVRVDPTAYVSVEEYQAQASADARATVADVLQWLPDAQKTAIMGAAPAYSNVDVSFPTSTTIRITLTYTYADAPLIPILTLPVIGRIPNVPDNLIVYSDALL